MPFVHTLPAAHTLPHAPQLAADTEISMQLAPQRFVPGRQSHWLLVQVSFVPQATPHTPQFAGLLVRSTHAP
jgi:hypothetical protein